MILGPACSVANEVMGEVAERHLNITQVRYTQLALNYTCMQTILIHQACRHSYIRTTSSV